MGAEAERGVGAGFSSSANMSGVAVSSCLCVISNLRANQCAVSSIQARRPADSLLAISMFITGLASVASDAWTRIKRRVSGDMVVSQSCSGLFTGPLTNARTASGLIPSICRRSSSASRSASSSA